MSSKDSRENLILAQKLIEVGDEKKALFFIEKVISENNSFLNRFFSNSLLCNAVFLKLKILNDFNDKEKLKSLFSFFSELTIENSEALLIYKKIAISDDFFSEKHAYNYLLKYPNDREMISFFVNKIINLSLFKKKYINIFKRYCLQRKKDYKVLEFTIDKIFEFKEFDLKFITIMLNYFYYFDNKNIEFEKNIFRFVDVFIKKYRFFHRKVFYPVFKFYYEKQNDKEILPYIFKIIKKNMIHDDFAQNICESMLDSNKKDTELISVLSGIYRAKNRVDKEALSIYSRLYDIEPKNFQNTKYLAKVLRDNNDISSQNIDIFLKAQVLFEEKEKASEEYKNLIEFLGNYLSREKNYNKKYRTLVEDILRICQKNEVFLYSVSFFKYNKEYDKAFFLLKLLDHEKLDELRKLEFYELYAEIFFSVSYTKNFLDYNWKKVFNFLKILKKSSKHKASFLISQYYILRKNKNRLPICFFTPGECEIWSEKCLFMNKLSFLKKSLLPRELNVIKEYCKLSDHPSAELFRKIFIEDNLYIPIDYNIPLSVCANIQKLISKDKFEEIFSLFRNNEFLIDYKGFVFWAGITFFNLKKYNDSIIFFTKVIDENPSNFYAYYYRGMSFYKKGSLRVCVLDFEKVIELKIYNERIIEEILQIYIKHKYIKEANKVCDILYSNEISKDKSQYYRAEILFIKKKYQESKKLIEELAETDFSQEKIRLLEIKILYELKEFESALHKSNRFVEKFSDNKEIYFQRALINIELKNYRLVKKDLEKFDDDIPEKYYYIMANASFNSGDIDESFHYIKKYREKAFFEIKSNLLLSKIYLKKNLGSEALKILKFTWFFSKNRNVLKELAVTNKILGNDKISFEYSKKYIDEKGFDSELLEIVLKNLLNINSLHSIYDLVEKYKDEEEIYINDNLKDIFKKCCFITGRFDVLIDKYNEKEEIYLKNKNAGKFYFINRSSHDKYNIFITKGNIKIFEIKDFFFSAEFFDDDIDYIFYCNAPKDIIGRLRYFSEKVYSIDLLFLIFDPEFNSDKRFYEISEVFFKTVENVRKMTPFQKNLVFLTGIFDDILLNFLEIYPVRKDYEIKNEELNIEIDKKLYLEINPESYNKRKILCRMKLKFWEDNLKIISNSTRKEFYTVCLWENLNYTYNSEIKRYKKKCNLNFNTIQFFYENIDCNYCDKCHYNCQLNKMTDFVKNSFYIIDALKLKNIDFKINSFNEDFKMFYTFFKDFFDLSEYIELTDIYVDILSKNEVFYKYDRILFVSYRECIDKIEDFSKNIKKLTDYFNIHREIKFSFNKDIRKLLDFLKIIIKNTRDSIKDIINRIEDNNIRVVLIEFIIRHIDRFEVFIDRLQTTPFTITENIEDNIKIYAKKKPDYINLLELKELDKDKITLFNKINSLERIMYYAEPLNYPQNSYKHDYFINKSEILKFLYIIKNSKYYFTNIDIRLILNVNLYLKELNKKSSIIVWKYFKNFENMFYSAGMFNKEEDFASFFTDDINKIAINKKYNNIFFMDNKNFIKIPRGLKFEKLFIYSKKEKNKNDEFAYLKLEKNDFNIIKSDKENSEKKENSVELNKIDDAIITKFYNDYLNGKINDIIIKNNLNLWEIIKFTDMNFNVYIKE
ncbi:MAG: hypothetical protein M0R46_05280 [Candidatus Muirbacterium halophilum]|nr:hypothetical protein [Candidatus Muirbacterium halophilum]MCK9475307.1 hypothetical protein [Candidatus Muirbacterium halophilum]